MALKNNRLKDEKLGRRGMNNLSVGAAAVMVFRNRQGGLLWKLIGRK